MSIEIKSLSSGIVRSGELVCCGFLLVLIFILFSTLIYFDFSPFVAAVAL